MGEPKPSRARRGKNLFVLKFALFYYSLASLALFALVMDEECGGEEGKLDEKITGKCHSGSQPWNPRFLLKFHERSHCRRVTEIFLAALARFSSSPRNYALAKGDNKSQKSEIGIVFAGLLQPSHLPTIKFKPNNSSQKFIWKINS